MAARDPSYRKIVNSWCMYDWANSAFATTIMAAMFPPFYRSLVKGAGFEDTTATAYWGYTNSFVLLCIALLAPILGAVSDQTGGRKKYIGFFVIVGVVSTAFMLFLGHDTYVAGSVLFAFGYIGFAGGNVFYESLLPSVATRNDIDAVSTRGYALGYVGGGVLLVINVFWYMKPEWFFFPDQGTALRACFLSVAVWWALFSFPLFLNVPEPPTRFVPLKKGYVRAGFRELLKTFRSIKQYKQLLLFLIAFWIYNDGIGTIIKMATAYGDEIGIDIKDMTIALVITQFVGIPFSFGFGYLSRFTGTKRAILIGLGGYALITLCGYFMETAFHFYMLAFSVGIVQGGTQGLSRSLYGAMVPKSRAAQFFGFFSTSSKFAGVLGPLFFGVVSQLAGGSRLSIALMVSFFLVGGVLLSLVNVEEGCRVAKEEDLKEGIVPDKG